MSSTKRTWPLVVGLLVLCAVIAVIPLVTVSGSEFSGADGEAESRIEEIDPGYEPWFSPVLEPPGGETESLLFCVQAAIGGGVLGYGFGFFRGRSRARKNPAQNPDDAAALDDSGQS